MTTTQRLSTVIPIAISSFLLLSCAKNSGDNLLMAPVVGATAITGETLQDYQQLLQNHSHQQTLGPASLQFFGERFASAKKRIYSIDQKEKGDTTHYSITLIFDELPNHDTVHTYRYDMQMAQRKSLLEITKMEQSWRCAQNKKSFSSEPCL